MVKPFWPEILFSCLGLLFTFESHSCYLFCAILPEPSSGLLCDPTALHRCLLMLVLP